ncbi:MAG: L,D-transpeptidase [Actinomycetota bacterium]|nr:L,D-transpeptidase [Actinomycetota bacterium]
MPVLIPRARTVTAVIAGVIPLVPIAVALSLGGGGTTPAVATARSPFSPAAPVSTAPRGRLVATPPLSGSLVATLTRPVALLTRPSGRAYGRLGLTTAFGSAETMLVVRSSGQWLGVLNPLAGNGRIGWIPAAAASLSRVRWRIDVSLSRRRVTVSDGGHVLRRYTVAIGAPASPTPTGRFAVTDRLHTPDPAGPYGCCILALSATAPHAIQGWNGGNRVAIHSTPETSSIGHPVSHGCIRLTLAEGRWLLRHIPLGTPTIIRT